MYGDTDILFAWVWGATVGFFAMLFIVAAVLKRK